MLDEDAQEPLQAAEDGAVEHCRGRALAAVGLHIRQAEPGRHGVVNLEGAELPGTPKGVQHLELDLGSVEGTPPGFGGGHALPEGFRQRGFGLVPDFVRPQPLLGARSRATLTSAKPKVA